MRLAACNTEARCEVAASRVGVGYVSEQLTPDAGCSHIGLNSVRERAVFVCYEVLDADIAET